MIIRDYRDLPTLRVKERNKNFVLLVILLCVSINLQMFTLFNLMPMVFSWLFLSGIAIAIYGLVGMNYVQRN